MKKFFLLIATAFTVYTVWAQDTTKVKVNEKEVVTVTEDTTAIRVKVMDKEVITIIEDSVDTKVNVGDEGGIEVITNPTGDTVKIRVGKRTVKVIGGADGTSIKTSREAKSHKEKETKFQGSWGGIELGANLFHHENYSMYPQELEGFFDIATPKSVTVNLNLAEYAFSNKQKTVALVTGMGFSFMDYRFDRNESITKESGTGIIMPVTLSDEAKKSKLTVSYLTLPLIFQVVTPLKMNHTPLTLGAGVIGGLNIGSHTKVKYNDSKEKERRSFHINPLKYDLTARIGMGDFSLFTNLGMTSLFKTHKGPEIRPVTIGILLGFD